MIQTQAQLADFLRLIKDEKTLAIDTEFKRINTYYPILCLLQIATKTQTDCIDMLAIDNLDGLFDKLYQDDCLWVVHSARQDIEAMYCLSHRLPKQLFDTQIAAALLGHHAAISYQALTQILQNVHLDKTYTRFDWTTRPLPAEALEYALDDVRYLLQSYQQLHAQLRDEGKLDWITQEVQLLLDINLYLLPLHHAWQKLKGLSRLHQSAQILAAQLCAWREHQAQSENKPRKWILSDEKIFNYALGKAALSNKAQHNFDTFIQQHSQIQNLSPNIEQNQPPSKAEKQQKQWLQKCIQQKANQYNLAPEIIASNKLLLQYIRGDQSVIFLRGWRYHLLQQELENAKQSQTR